LKSTLGDVPVDTAITGSGPVSQRVHGIVDVSRVGEFEETLEIDAGNLVGPAGSRGLIEMATKVPT
jgi:hypothetical protein